MTERIATLRRERATIERTYRAQAYPRAFKHLAVELYRELACTDLTDYQIARKLGIHIETVRRWDKAAPRTVPPPPDPAPLPVAVRGDHCQPLLRRPLSVQQHQASPAGITLVAPGGWRLENLDLEQAIVVLDKLARQPPC